MLQSRTVNDVTVVNLTGTDRLNALVSDKVKKELLEHFSKPNVRMVFDLDGISFIDSSGFGVFLNALKAASNNYGQFKICRASVDVMELFRVLQLHHVFELYEEMEECLESFKH